MPTPFDMGAIIGPVLNEGSEEEFKKELRLRIRRFLHSHPNPINVQTEVVEQNLIRKLLIKSKGQTTLVGLGVEPNSGRDEWLSNQKPWKILKTSQLEHTESLSQLQDNIRHYVPKSILAHSISSIVGTLSIMSNADIGELRSAQGPVRAVSESHSHKIIRYLNDDLDWLHQHRSLIGRDTSRNQLKEHFLPFGYLVLAIWPLRVAIQKWIKENPKTHLRYCLGQIIRTNHNSVAIDNCLKRIKILGSGKPNTEVPNDYSSLISWWQGNN